MARRERFDPMALFISYNRRDQIDAVNLCDLLQENGVDTFLDIKDLSPGFPWQPELERAIVSAGAVAILIGEHGLGYWQAREKEIALDLQRKASVENRRFPVIPVLLSGAQESSGFLVQNTWIDFRNGLDNPSELARLVRAVGGEEGDVVVNECADICPYRGLETFGTADAPFYYGRERFVELLLQKIKNHPVITLVGPSGSGKSSLVRAGLLARLAREHRPDLVWDVVVVRPGNAPWWGVAYELVGLAQPQLPHADRLVEASRITDALTRGGSTLLRASIEEALHKAGGSDRLLLVVDQFEELFSLTPTDQQGPFIQALLECARTGPVTVLMVLRADYYGRAIESSRELSDEMALGQVNLGAMRMEELRAAIVQPAERVGLTLEKGLVERLLDEVKEEPGVLPLLEYALVELWKGRSGRTITHATYEQFGGIGGVLANRCREYVRELPDEARAAVKWLFLRLLQVAGEGDAGSDTRRRASRSEVGEESWKQAQMLAGQRNRLVVTSRDVGCGEEVVELAHESLLRNWEQYREWIREERLFLEWRQNLGPLVRHWERSGTDEAPLLTGSVLQEAREWQKKRKDALNAAETRYLEASGRRAERKRRIVHSIWATGVLITLVAAAWFAYTRTDSYQIRSILAANDDVRFLKAEQMPRNRFLGFLAVLGQTPQAISFINSIDDHERRHYAFDQVASILRKCGHTEDAKRILLQDEKLIGAIEDSKNRLQSLIRLATQFQQLGLVEDRNRALRGCTRILSSIKEPTALSEASLDLAQAVGNFGLDDIRHSLTTVAVDAFRVSPESNYKEFVRSQLISVLAETNGDMGALVLVLSTGQDDLQRRIMKVSDVWVDLEVKADRLDRALAISRRLPLPSHRASKLLSIAGALQKKGRRSEAMSLVEEADSLVGTGEPPWGDGLPHSDRSDIVGALIEFGRLDEAESKLDSMPPEKVRSNYRYQLAVAHIQKGNLAEARRLLALEPAAEERVRILVRIAEDLRTRGNLKEAMHQADEALRLASGVRDRPCNDLYWMLARLEVSLGRLRRARLIAERGESYSCVLSGYSEILEARLSQVCHLSEP